MRKTTSYFILYLYKIHSLHKFPSDNLQGIVPRIPISDFYMLDKGLSLNMKYKKDSKWSKLNKIIIQYIRKFLHLQIPASLKNPGEQLLEHCIVMLSQTSPPVHEVQSVELVHVKQAEWIVTLQSMNI